LRKSKDIILELKNGSDSGQFSSLVLVVGFTHKTDFIFGTTSASEALTKLNDLMLEGGKPIGFVGMTQNDRGSGAFYTRLLSEYPDRKSQALQECRRYSQPRATRTPIHGLA